MNSASSLRVFPAAFWSANIVELFERAAYYGMFITITLYLTNLVGFGDVAAAWVSGVFAAGLYFLPPFMGAVADRIGFRNALLLAFALLTTGYFLLGALPYKLIVLPSLVILMFGGSFIKSVITGTVAKTTTTQNRARGFSIFYAMVNIGSFTGKTFAYPLRIQLGVEYINFFSAGCTLLALLVVFFFYRNVEVKEAGKSTKELVAGLIRIVTNFRLLLLIIIVTGFWIVQHQLYATMPKYIIRTVGTHASPEWIANINPFIVVLLVIVITKLMKAKSALFSMTVGMFLMPVSALCMAASPLLQKYAGLDISILSITTAHPITIMLIIGIVFQALAECFISPRYLEFFSLQAPKGEEGLYLGFSHLHSFLSSILGFGLSGYLLAAYCPDPKTLSPTQLPGAYTDAYMIWYYFAAIGLIAALALILYSIKYKPGSDSSPSTAVK